MKVHELIDKPEKWLKGIVASTEYATQGHNPREGTAKSDATIDGAKSFCLYGGLCRIFGEYSPEVKEGLDKITAKVGRSAINWNNSPDLTFEEFHRVLVEADV